MDAPPPPTPAVRVVHGIAFRAAHRPDAILSPATLGLQEIARAAGSRQAGSWAVFPVHGQGVVVAGYLSARTPVSRDHLTTIEPGGTLSFTHEVVAYSRSSGGAVGNIRHDRQDGDCVDEFVEALSATDAWAALGATPLDLGALPGAEHLDEESGPAFLLLSDDGRVGEVVYGMSFWRPGSTYDEGPVQTWTHPVADGDAVRVVGVAVGRVDERAPLAVAPRTSSEETDARRRAIERETRAVLDSERPFSWYFIAGAAQPSRKSPGETE
jgi:hypothetical protein